MSKEEDHFSYQPSQYIQSYQSLRQDIIQKQQQQSNQSNSTVDDITSSASSTTSKKKLIVAAVQLETKPPSSSSSSSTTTTKTSLASDFYARATQAVQEAVQTHNATLVLLPELFLGPYFCQCQDASLFQLAESDLDVNSHDEANSDGSTSTTTSSSSGSSSPNAFIKEFQELAKRWNVVLPISIFERKNMTFYNSVIMIDADGSIVGKYRKSHIPDGTGYQEKFYFSPGDTGFQVFSTCVGTIGVGICWDQWFPEAARSMALLGADVLLYPTAIGSEPQDPTLDSSAHWQRVMQGHAAANMIPVIASNRYGTEILLDDNNQEKQRIKFYGKSFITDETGAIQCEAKDGSDIICQEVNVEENRSIRSAWGLFRDRRPELYGVLKTKDGHLQM